MQHARGIHAASFIATRAMQMIDHWKPLIGVLVVGWWQVNAVAHVAIHGCAVEGVMGDICRQFGHG